jgi:hypothetical protein
MKTKLTPEQKYAKLAVKTSVLLRKSADGLMDMVIADNFNGHPKKVDDARTRLASECSEMAGWFADKYVKV